MGAVAFLIVALRADTREDDTIDHYSSLHDDDCGDKLRYLTIQESFWLGVGLTLTNFGTGIVGGAIRLSPFYTSLMSFLSSLCTIGGGEWLGVQLQRGDSNWPSIVSALLLIAFALNVLLTN